MTRIARPWLLPLVPAYRLALALREMQFRTGLKPVRRLRWPVVSVGNLSAGGAGKTPLVIALARALTAHGVDVDVLSRGYGRRSRLPLLVDPHGIAEDFGDEPLVIARQTQAPVYVAAERYEAGFMVERASRQAGESARHGTGVHLLDDGFQHRQLARDVDILLLSRADLRDRLLPAGNLRETSRAAERADVIAISADEPELGEWVRMKRWEKQVWRLHRRMDVPEADGPVAAFCGIARPEQFFAGLEGAGLHLAARMAFADHHRYTHGDLERIAAAASRGGAAVLLTTEKDCARLGELAQNFPAQVPLKSVALRMEIDDEATAIDWLLRRIPAPNAANAFPK